MKNFKIIVENIENILKNSADKSIVIAIDGYSGSGKSFLAEYLLNKFDCNVFHMDHYFLQKHQRTPERFAQIGGNIDKERLLSELFPSILTGKDFSWRAFKCSDMTLGNWQEIKAKKLTIIEGVYSMHPDFRNFYDYKIFINVDREVQKTRILQRSGAEKLERYLNEWIPLENRYFDFFEVEKNCDISIISE